MLRRGAGSIYPGARLIGATIPPQSIPPENPVGVRFLPAEQRLYRLILNCPMSEHLVPPDR
jgi:hypothetical protein